MDPTLLVVILGIIEGLTEFVPVSSTGHLVLAGALIGLPPGSETFDIVIQLGAILAVVVLYYRKLLDVLLGIFRREAESLAFLRNILISFLPAGIVGALAYSAIKQMLESPRIVAAMLIAGGIAMLLLDRTRRTPTTTSVETMRPRIALGIGMLQCLSMIPGVSRSGATILGALALGVERRVAAEYSFFLAIPTMMGATTLALWKARDTLELDHLGAIGIGFAVSFVVAMLVIRWFLAIVSRHGFAPFAWYRIAVGLGALLWLS